MSTKFYLFDITKELISIIHDMACEYTCNADTSIFSRSGS